MEAPPRAATSPAGVGTVLNGRYRLDRLLGRGGFALVFLATDLTLRRQVAVKVLHAELTEDQGHDFLARFTQEARAVAVLDHPNILSIHDYGEALGTIYLVMPYVDGGTLHDRLRAVTRVGPADAGRYLRQVAAALDYAHRRNLVHRDIKPQNMLLRAEDDHLLLADFGIAKVISGTSAQSRTSVMGTIAYMAPEQFEGIVSPATDIYALGCVLFQLLTGQVPFDGSTEQVIFSHLQKPLPRLAERSIAGLPAAIQEVLERAVAKRPDARYRTAGEFSAAYDAALAGNLPAPDLRVAPTVAGADSTVIAPGSAGLGAASTVITPGPAAASPASDQDATIIGGAAHGISGGMTPPLGGIIPPGCRSISSRRRSRPRRRATAAPSSPGPPRLGAVALLAAGGGARLALAQRRRPDRHRARANQRHQGDRAGTDRPALGRPHGRTAHDRAVARPAANRRGRPGECPADARTDRSAAHSPTVAATVAPTSVPLPPTGPGAAGGDPERGPAPARRADERTGRAGGGLRGRGRCGAAGTQRIGRGGRFLA